MQRRIWRVPQPIPALSTAAKTRIMLESFGLTYVRPPRWPSQPEPRS